MEIAIGFLIGLAIGLTGVGGGTLTAPALILVMGYPPRSAVATALVFSAAVKVFASGAYLIRGRVDLRILGYLMCGGLPGAIIGAIALERLQIAKANEWVLCTIGALVTSSAVGNIMSSRRRAGRSAARLHLLPFFSLPIGLESGFSASGAGALGTVMLFQFTALAPIVVVGTDLVFGLAVSAIAGGVHAYSGACNWNGLVRLIPSGIVGSMVGVHTCSALPTQTLRKLVLICAACVGLSLFLRGLGGIL
jgi:uncharacterized membrane protein YfcA